MAAPPASTRNGLIWTNKTLIRNSKLFPIYFQAGVTAIVERFQQKVLEYMQENAPWEDQTGAAREGLNTSVESSIGEWVMTLSHGVDYGIWLEIRWSGAYAIILPTILHMGPQLMAELDMAVILSGL